MGHLLRITKLYVSNGPWPLPFQITGLGIEQEIYCFNMHCKHSFSEIHEVSCNKLTNIGGKTCNNILEAVNKLALSVCLGHSWEAVWNKYDSSYIILNKTKVLSQGKILANFYLQVYDKLYYRSFKINFDCQRNLYQLIFKRWCNFRTKFFFTQTA